MHLTLSGGCVAVTERVLFERALAELKALANIIQSSIETIEATVTANSLTYPSPSSIFTPQSEAPLMHPAIMLAGSHITSAASQLLTVTRSAPLVLFDITMQVTMSVPSQSWIIANNVWILKFHLCTALRTVISLHVAEILRNSGPNVT